MDTVFAVVLFENVLGCVNLYLNVADLNVKAASPFLYMYCFFHVNTKRRTEQFIHDIARLKVKKTW